MGGRGTDSNRRAGAGLERAIRQIFPILRTRRRRLCSAGGDTGRPRRCISRLPRAGQNRGYSEFQSKAAERAHAINRPRWRNQAHTSAWLQTLQRHAFPVLAHLPVDRIQRHDVLKVLEPIWAAKPETARRVRQRIRTSLSWCQAYGYVVENVAGPGIDGALPRIRKVKRHFRAFPYREVAAGLSRVERSPASPSVKLCLKFLVLTAARGIEAREARWNEMDLPGATWRIPATRMKTGSEHRVPLSGAALAVLRKADKLQDGSGLVFPSPRRPGLPLSNMALMKVLRDVGLADRTTVHGMRSSFRDFCADTGQPRAVAEAALAHTVPGVEGAYFRSDLFEKRRAVMQAWTDFVMPQVPI